MTATVLTAGPLLLAALVAVVRRRTARRRRALRDLLLAEHARPTLTPTEIR